MNQNQIIQNITIQYKLNAPITHATPLTTGKINTTYLLTTETTPYILQKINSTIFKHPLTTMKNIQYITQNDTHHLFPKLLYTIHNKPYVLDNSNVWRLYELSGTRIIKEELNSSDFYQLGKRIAQMHKFLGTKENTNITPAIPDFCNVTKRIDNLQAEYAKCSVKNPLVEEIYTYLDQRSQKAKEIDELFRSDKLPQSIIHNDLTINNIVWNDQLKDYVMIDLDTMNVGTILYDLGDFLRNVCTDKHNEQITFNLDNCNQILSGYLAWGKESISKQEISLVPDSIWIMTYFLCTRYLLDYLMHNVYFKTTYEKENLDRAREKMLLLKEIEEKEKGIETI